MSSDAILTLPAGSRDSQSQRQAPRVGVLVHNTVERDARVLKGIRTLESAGYRVTAFGLVGKQDHARTLHVEGIGADIHLGEPQRHLRHKRARRQFKELTGLLQRLTKIKLLLPLALFCALGLGLVAGLAAGSFAAGLMAALPVMFLAGIGIVVGRLVRKRRKKARRQSQTVPTGAEPSPAISEVEKKRRLIRSHSLALEQLVEAHGPFDFLHCHDIIALEAGTHLARRHGWPIIWDAHELYEHLARDEPSRAQANRQVIDEAQGIVAGCITISESFADYYAREHPGLPPAAIVMNATLGSVPAIDDGRLRRATGLPPERRILIYQGGFAPHRGLHELVGAMAHVDEPWSLVMMGWGNLQDELEDLAAPINAKAIAAGAPPKIVFIPPAPQTELAAWTAGATLGVIAYEDNCLNHTYCTPNKLWEYPNAGVPILASDLVEIRKLIQAFGTGFLMPPDGEAKELAKRINDIDATALADKRDNCTEFVARHNWARFEPALLGVYDRIQKAAKSA